MTLHPFVFMEKKVEKNLLYDFYSGMLTKHQQTILGLYYNLDISLSEIAAQLGMSRQAVYDAVKTGEKLLEELEEKLGCMKRYLLAISSIEKCEKIIDKIESENKAELEQIKKELKKLKQNQ